MADVNQVIKRCVDDIWDEYDTDKNETLDKEECRAFVINTIKEFTGQECLDDYPMDTFDSSFAQFDIDNNGTIDKSEMVRFIRKVAGLSVGKL